MLIKFEKPVNIHDLQSGYDCYFDDEIVDQIVNISAIGVDSASGKTLVQALNYFDRVLDEDFVDSEEIIWEAPEEDWDAACEDDVTEDDYEEPSYIINKDSVTLTYQDEVYTTDKSNANFKEIIELILEQNYSAAVNLFSPSAAISNWVDGLLEVRDDRIFYDNFEIKGKFVEKIIKHAQNDLDVASFLKFLKLTMEQEDVEVRNRLLDFAADDTIDFSDEGYVIAFKNVRGDYYDKHSGKFRNMVGDKPSVPRSSVDANHNTTCSTGLHVCSFKYLVRCWGTSGRNMVVHVNPKDFVAIPYDYDDSKARVSTYTVVDELSQDKVQQLVDMHM